MTGKHYMDEKLSAKLAAINAVSGKQTSLRWREAMPRHSWQDTVCVVDENGKALSVYMAPSTMAKRLDMMARIVGV